MNPLKAIRKNCLDCCCDSPHEVRLCHLDHCDLHPFRFGKNPYRQPRNYTPEQKEALAAQLKANLKKPRLPAETKPDAATPNDPASAAPFPKGDGG